MAGVAHRRGVEWKGFGRQEAGGSDGRMPGVARG
jgi:hypothetical protein